MALTGRLGTPTSRPGDIQPGNPLTTGGGGGGGGLSVYPNFIADSAQVYAPTVRFAQTVRPDFIGDTGTLQFDVSGPSNYYSHIEGEANFPSAGFAPGTPFTITVQCTSSVPEVTDQIGFDVYLRRAAPSTESCFHWAYGITPSGAPHTPISGTWPYVNDPTSIEWTATVGATGCDDFTRIVLNAFVFSYPGTWNITMHVTVSYTPSVVSGVVYPPSIAYGHPVRWIRPGTWFLRDTPDPVVHWDGREFVTTGPTVYWDDAIDRFTEVPN